MMARERKRSIGVTIIATALIVVAIFMLVFSVISLKAPYLPRERKLEYMRLPQWGEPRITTEEQFDRWMRKSGMGFLIIAIPLLVSGIGILRLKNWARLLLFGFYTVVFLLNLLNVSILKAKIISPMSFIIYIFLLYFFTRPKVKEQFSSPKATAWL